jgi:hypothetical protein
MSSSPSCRQDYGGVKRTEPNSTTRTSCTICCTTSPTDLLYNKFDGRLPGKDKLYKSAGGVTTNGQVVQQVRGWRDHSATSRNVEMLGCGRDSRPLTDLLYSNYKYHPIKPTAAIT